jgi:hypothetical protein
MKFTIPKTRQSEHDALHDRLRQASEVGAWLMTRTALG